MISIYRKSVVRCIILAIDQPPVIDIFRAARIPLKSLLYAQNNGYSKGLKSGFRGTIHVAGFQSVVKGRILAI
jgi:hypothetical protein